jgi:hypothetical protein
LFFARAENGKTPKENAMFCSKKMRVQWFLGLLKNVNSGGGGGKCLIFSELNKKQRCFYQK